MKSICTMEQFKSHFGSLYDKAYELMVNEYKLITINNDSVYFTFVLSYIFDEPMELFSVDSSLVYDIFTINPIFNNESEAELEISIIDWLSEYIDYEPISSTGELSMTFDDIREWYGESFDSDMNQLYSNYVLFKEYFSEM